MGLIALLLGYTTHLIITQQDFPLFVQDLNWPGRLVCPINPGKTWISNVNDQLCSFLTSFGMIHGEGWEVRGRTRWLDRKWEAVLIVSEFLNQFTNYNLLLLFDMHAREVLLKIRTNPFKWQRPLSLMNKPFLLHNWPASAWSDEAGAPLHWMFGSVWLDFHFECREGLRINWDVLDASDGCSDCPQFYCAF